MKLRKIIVRSCIGLALAFALATGAGYCWLNSWRWGSAPEAHESFSADEVALLQPSMHTLQRQLILIFRCPRSMPLLRLLSASVGKCWPRWKNALGAAWPE